MKLQHEEIFKLTDEEAADALLDIISNDLVSELTSLTKDNDKLIIYKAFTIGFFSGLQQAGSSCNLNCENCGVPVEKCKIMGSFYFYNQLKEILSTKGRTTAKDLVMSLLRRARTELDYKERHYW